MVRDSATEMRISDEQREYAMNRIWIAAPSSVPTRYWMSKPNTIRLMAPPNDVYAMTYRGCREAAALSASTDTPGLPNTYHEAIALRAAVLHCQPFMSTPEQKGKLDEYRSIYSGLVKDCRMFLAADDMPKQRTTIARRPELVWPGYSSRGMEGP